MLDVVELGELAARARHVEALELLERLLSEVGPVDEEQDPLRTGAELVVEQPLGRCSRQQNVLPDPVAIWIESTGVVVLQRRLEVADGGGLGIT